MTDILSQKGLHFAYLSLLVIPHDFTHFQISRLYSNLSLDHP